MTSVIVDWPTVGMTWGCRVAWEGAMPFQVHASRSGPSSSCQATGGLHGKDLPYLNPMRAPCRLEDLQGLELLEKIGAGGQ